VCVCERESAWMSVYRYEYVEVSAWLSLWTHAGISTGAEGIKTMDERHRFGGFANAPYDPCYHLACDTVENIDKTVLMQMSQCAGEFLSLRVRLPVCPPLSLPPLSSLALSLCSWPFVVCDLPHCCVPPLPLGSCCCRSQRMPWKGSRCCPVFARSWVDRGIGRVSLLLQLLFDINYRYLSHSVVSLHYVDTRTCVNSGGGTMKRSAAAVAR
jgi:hypothetical protein